VAFAVENVLAAYSATTAALHEYFDQTRGMTVLQLARADFEIAGVVSVHGSLKTTRPAHQGKLKAKILVCHGALDPHVPMTEVSAFVKEMNNSGADWQLIVYGGAMHGFTHENAGNKTSGVAYNAVADARSWSAIREFFGELFDGVVARI
jgi:dienelactone hydrolase